MNSLDFYTGIYRHLHYRKCINKLISPLRYVVRKIGNKSITTFLSKPSHYTDKGDDSVVVSLTSFPARINNVWQVVECMKRQSCRPKKILLWLSKDQFPLVSDIPERLYNMQDDVFCIRLVEGDIKSHKKHYYVFQEYPNHLIVLIDDDLYYPTNMIRDLVDEYNKDNNFVICRYGYEMRYENGNLRPYKDWPNIYRESSDLNIFFGSGGGTLICNSELCKDFSNKELFMALTPTADDIWLNAMIRLSGKKVKIIPYGLLFGVTNSNNQTLSSVNLHKNKNDVQISQIRSHYIKEIGMDPFKQML